MKNKVFLQERLDNLFWSIIFKKELRLIQINSSGKAKYNELIYLNKSVMDFAENHNCKNLMIDHRKTHIDLSIYEVCKLRNVYEDNGLHSGYQISLLTTKENSTELQYKLFDAIFRSIGMNYRLFYCLEDAFEWFCLKYPSK